MTMIDPTTVPQRTLYTGAKMPAVGMGTFGSDHADADAVSAAVAGAIRVGYRSFDCAACYGNEDMIGKVFADAFDEGSVKREDLFIASKVWNDMHGDDILGMLNQALIKRVHYLVCQCLAVLKIPDGLDPELPPEPRLQDSPSSMFCLRCQRLCANPVHKQVHKFPGVLLVPGHLVSLPQADKEPVAVKLENEFFIIPRHIPPINPSLRKFHRLPGSLQILF